MNVHACAQLTYGNVAELKKRCEAKLDECCTIHGGRSHLCSTKKYTHTLCSSNFCANLICMGIFLGYFVWVRLRVFDKTTLHTENSRCTVHKVSRYTVFRKLVQDFGASQQTL